MSLLVWMVGVQTVQGCDGAILNRFQFIQRFVTGSDREPLVKFVKFPLQSGIAHNVDINPPFSMEPRNPIASVLTVVVLEEIKKMSQLRLRFIHAAQTTTPAALSDCRPATRPPDQRVIKLQTSAQISGFRPPDQPQRIQS